MRRTEAREGALHKCKGWKSQVAGMAGQVQRLQDRNKLGFCRGLRGGQQLECGLGDGTKEAGTGLCSPFIGQRVSVFFSS